jgi:hypothetical protein
MTGSPNTKLNSNSPNGGGGGGNGGRDMYNDIMNKLKRGERVEIFSYEEPAEEQPKVEEQDTLNLRVNIGVNGNVAIRSGGWLILITNDRKVVAVRDGEGKRTYESSCLAANLKELLLELLVKYKVGIALQGWVRVSLPRSDKTVRMLQSWILAIINNTFNVLKDNPMNCPSFK